jgi:MFS family permease
MIRVLSPVGPLLLGVAILLAGQGLQSTLLPLRASLEGFSTLSIGLMGGAYFFGFTLGCLRGPNILARVGHIRVFAAMTAAASAAPLFHGLWPDAWLWWALRFVTGYCFAVLYVVIESWLNEQATNETRGTVFSAYTLITLTVMAAGQQLLNLYDPGLMALFALASALVSVAALPVVLSARPSPNQPEHKIRLNLRRLFIVSPAGALGCLAAGLTTGAFWALAPVFVVSSSADYSLAAWFMTAAVLGGALGQWPLGFWSDHVDRRWVVGFASLLAMAIGVVMGLSSGIESRLNLLLLSAAWGAVAFPVYSISVAHANDNAGPDEYIMISSALLLMYGMGAILGPFVAPGVMRIFGPGGLYLFTAAIHLMFLSYIMVRFIRRPSEREAEQGHFADALAKVQSASSVYEEDENYQWNPVGQEKSRDD